MPSDAKRRLRERVATNGWETNYIVLSDGEARAVLAELDALRQKYADAKAELDAARREVEGLKAANEDLKVAANRRIAIQQREQAEDLARRALDKVGSLVRKFTEWRDDDTKGYDSLIGIVGSFVDSSDELLADPLAIRLRPKS